MGAGSSLGQGWPDCEYYSDHSGVVGAEGGGNRHWVGKEVSGFTLEGWSHNSGSVLPDQGRYIATPTGLLPCVSAVGSGHAALCATPSRWSLVLASGRMLDFSLVRPRPASTVKA